MVSLSGDQEVPPIMTDTFGDAIVRYDSINNTFDIDMRIDGLELVDDSDLPELIMAHFHVGAEGSNGPVIVDLLANESFVAERDGNLRLNLTDVAFPSENIDDLVAGNVYINVHSSANVPGEVRGQIVLTGSSASGGGILTLGDLTVEDSEISGNMSNRAGGGIESVAGTMTTLTNIMLSDNITGPMGQAAPGNGGGFHITGDGDAMISGGTVSGNTAAREGGGLWNGSGTMIVDGTTITGNTALGDAAEDGGGGVFNNGGDLQIIGGMIAQNTAVGEAGSGGGVLNLDGSLSISETLIIGNDANRAGGGIETEGGNVTLNNVDVSDNSVVENSNPGNGGGLHIGGPSIVMVSGGRFAGNRAVEGGGLWNSASGTLDIDSVDIENNVAAGDAADQGGGGVYNDGGTISIVDSSISDNVATGDAGSGGGVLTIGGELSIENTTIDFNGANRAGGGIEIVDGTLLLDGVNLLSNDVAGDATGGDPAPGNGGGIHVSGVAEITIGDSIVSGNVAGSEGGGLWNQAGSTMTIHDDSVIQFNIALGDAADNGGGGVFNNGGAVIIDDATIISNFADGESGSGGGILNVAGGTVAVTDSLIADNVASRAGGGIEDASETTPNDDDDNDAITLTRVDLIGNNAGVIMPGRGGALFSNPGSGGGLHVTGGGNVTITDSNVVDNLAASQGGGLWNGTGTMTVTGSTLATNSATHGGGIYNNGESGDVNLTNVTISSNEAETGGGMLSQGGEVTMTSVTVAMNAADTGGGIVIQGGTAMVVSSIIAENEAETDAQISGTVTDGGFNVIADEADLQPLAANGGRTETHALGAASPALGNGDPDGVEIDQRGLDRPGGPGFDSGAFESLLDGSASGLQNAAFPADVNGNGVATPIDALMILNFIRRGTSGSEGEIESQSLFRGGGVNKPDVDGDGDVTPLDALIVINTLRRAADHNDELGREAGDTAIPEADSAFYRFGVSVVDERREQIDELLLQELAIDALRSR